VSTEEVAHTVLDARNEALERLRASKLGQEVAKLEKAYVALTGSAQPDFLFETFDGVVVIVDSKARRGARSGSVRSVMLNIINGSPPALWTYDELAVALETEGIRVRDGDGKIKSSLRTATWQLVSDGDAMRGPGTTIYATKHAEELERSGALTESADGTIFSLEGRRG
jgi:hypothetical protein